MKTKVHLFGIVAAASFGITVGCLADELILTPIDDTWISNSSSVSNYDDDHAGMSGTSASIAPQYPYFRFDLSQVSGSLASVQLRLYVSSLGTGGSLRVTELGTSLDGYGDDWNGILQGNGDETTLAWSNAPARQAYAYTGTCNGSGWWQTAVAASGDDFFDNIIKRAYDGDGIASFAIVPGTTFENGLIVDREGHKGLKLTRAPQLILTGTNLSLTTQVVVHPQEDSWINLSAVSENYDGDLDGMYANSATISPKYPYLKFDVFDVFGDVTKTKLNLWVNTLDVSGTIRVSQLGSSTDGYGDDWNGNALGDGGERTLTWNNAPTRTSYEYTSSINGTGWWNTLWADVGDGLFDNIVDQARQDDNIVSLAIVPGGTCERALVVDREGNPGLKLRKRPELVLAGVGVEKKVIVVPTEDGYINTADSINYDDHISGIAIADDANRAYLKFDLSQVRGEFTGVQLRLRVESVVSDGNLAIYKIGNSTNGYGDDWNGGTAGKGDEVTLTGGNAPSLGTPVYTGGTIDATGWWESAIFRATDDFFKEIIALALEGDRTASLALVGDSQLSIRIGDKEGNPGSLANVAQLVFTGPNVFDAYAQSREKQDLLNSTFLRGMWYTKDDADIATDFADFKSHHINFVHVGNGEKEKWTDQLKIAEEEGLYVMFGPDMHSISGGTGDYDTLLNRARTNIFDYIDIYSPHLISYYLWDEPVYDPSDSNPDEREDLRKIHTVYSQADVGHPGVSLIYNPSYNLTNISDMWEYTRPKSQMLLDVYSFFTNTATGDFSDVWQRGIEFTDWLDDARDEITSFDNTPLGITLQGFYANSTYRQPTANEIKCTAWMSLGHGAKMLAFFTWHDFVEPGNSFTGVESSTAIYNAIADVYADFEIIGEALVLANSTSNVATISGGGSAFYSNGDVATLLEDSYLRSPAYAGYPGDFDLFADATIADDITAETNETAKVTNDSTGWNIQWQWGSNPSFVANLEYDLYAVVKVEYDCDGFDWPVGDAFKFGVWDVGSTSSVVSTTPVPVEITRHGVYETYKIGTFEPESDQYVYISGTNNESDVPYIFVEKFYFVPKGDHYLVAVNRDMAQAENLTISFPADTVDKYGQGNLTARNVLTGTTYPLSGTVTKSFTVNNVLAGEGVAVRIESAP